MSLPPIVYLVLFVLLFSVSFWILLLMRLLPLWAKLLCLSVIVLFVVAVLGVLTPQVMLLLLCLIVSLFVIIVRLISLNPFSYPYFVYDFDVSGKREPRIEDLVDQYLIEHGLSDIEDHSRKVADWERSCERLISKSIVSGYRLAQYNLVCDSAHTFKFNLVRRQMRYRQHNYVKTSYHVDMVDKTFSYSFDWLVDRYKALEAIGFACSLQQYHSKNQRKFATRELREKIMKRDNYTCQICGKYMPDEVGLQIDHIIPVSKGGKTIESNMQVLCSVCNGKKSDK